MLKLLLAATAFLTSCVTTNDSANQSDPRKAAAMMIERDEAVLVDVREADELNAGMAKPAMWLPTSKINADAPELYELMGKLDKDKTVFVYCTAGGRAGNFVDLLREKGFKAENLGGFEEWAKAGLPVTTGTPHH